MKKINLFLVIIVLTLSNCVNTRDVNTTPPLESAEQEYAEPEKGLPAPPGLRGLFQSGNDTAIEQKGVVINGVEWATRNVNRNGAFVERPEDAGWTYQWNSIRPEFSMWQSTAGLLPESFLVNYPVGSFWERSKDPSPQGWRVPTYEEVNSLFDTSRVINEWATLNGVTGRRFTDRFSGESIFFPAVGRWYADISSGDRDIRKMDIGTGGYYWTAAAQGDYGAIAFEFNSEGASFQTNHRTITYMIRPVADQVAGSREQVTDNR